MMSATVRGRFTRSLARLSAIAAACLCVVGAGCTRTPNSAERLKAAYESSGMTQVTVYPLAGTVTVDHAAPTFKSRRELIVVMAYDTAKSDKPVTENAFVTVLTDGSFAFPDGGLPPGKYVMLFAQLQLNKREGWHGPDALKNLYNDPDVNSKKAEFLIEHQAPGKTDYVFDLSVAGQTAAQPGPKALVHLPG
jgi:hypothetical protein